MTSMTVEERSWRSQRLKKNISDEDITHWFWKQLADLSRFKIKKHAKKEWGIAVDISGKDADEVVEDVIEQLKGGGGQPECFGNYADFEKCSECDDDEECSDATEESTE